MRFFLLAGATEQESRRSKHPFHAKLDAVHPDVVRDAACGPFGRASNIELTTPRLPEGLGALAHCRSAPSRHRSHDRNSPRGNRTDIPHAVSDLTSIHRLTASERPLLAAITLKFTEKYRATQSCLYAGRSRPKLAKCLTIRLDRCRRQISQWMR